MRRAWPIVFLVSALASGCGPRTTLEPAPAPPDWAESLDRHRRERDLVFARDPDSPIPPSLRGSFRGLEYWPADPSWRFVGTIERYPAPPRFTIVTTSGVERPCEKVGWISFPTPAGTGILQVYRLLDQPQASEDEGLFLPFQDATTGRDSYPAGRYVDLTGPPGGPYLLDFNRAYNPLCAYGSPERYRCPVTPAENRLPFPVPAGERGWHRPSGAHGE